MTTRTQSAEKILHAQNQSKTVAKRLSLADFSVIPGAPLSHPHPVLVLYSTKAFPPTRRSPYQSPEFCLRELEDDIRERLRLGIPIRVIKVLIDRLDPESWNTLGKVCALVGDLVKSKVYIDLMRGRNVRPLLQERRTGWSAELGVA